MCRLQRACTPTPREAFLAARAAPSRIFSLFPARLYGIRRTSRRLGSIVENGRRLLVFSFSLGKPALRFNRGSSLLAQVLRSVGGEHCRSGWEAVHFQSDQLLHSPSHVKMVDLCR